MISELSVITLKAVLTEYLDQWDGTSEGYSDFPLGEENLSVWVSMVVACRPYIAERLAYIMSEEAEQELYTMLLYEQTETSNQAQSYRKIDIARALLKVRVLWHVIQTVLDTATLHNSDNMALIIHRIEEMMTRLPDGIHSLVTACLEPVFTKQDPAWWLPEYQWWRAVRNSSRPGTTTWN